LVPVFEETVRIPRAGIRPTRGGGNVEKNAPLPDVDCTLRDVPSGVRKYLLLALVIRAHEKDVVVAISLNCGKRKREGTLTYKKCQRPKGQKIRRFYITEMGNGKERGRSLRLLTCKPAKSVFIA
jgi:hypothetical protein